MSSNHQNRMVKLVLLFNSSADCFQTTRTTDLDSMKSSEKQSFGILENYRAVSNTHECICILKHIYLYTNNKLFMNSKNSIFSDIPLV